MDYTVARDLNTLYIILDCIWLVIFATILWVNGKKTAIVVGVLAGVLYFIVDYGFFHLALGTRSVVGANTFIFLFWLSMSYGFTNFAWIWLILENDGRRLEWSLLPIIGWLVVGLVSQEFGNGFQHIHIQRNVAGYHGYMAVILAVGYLILIVRNISGKQPKAPLATLLLTGIGVQFAWEAILLITGIRPDRIEPLLINSLIETNLGMPFIYMIFQAVTRARTPVTVTGPARSGPAG